LTNKEFVKYASCRFCKSNKITKVITLGKMPLAGGFLKNIADFKNEKKFPLDLFFCRECYLIQTSIAINPDKLFKKYFYFSSKIQTLIDHFQKTALKINKSLKNGSFVVEIGCNDGEFIKALQKNGYRALGIDPASNIVKPLIKTGAPIINDYFSENLAKKIVKKHGQADAIYSFHTLAHIPDMLDIIKGIKLLLKSEGYLAFEVHYIGDLLKGLQYDMIYHEHLHYYSLLSLKNLFKQFNMEIFKIEKNKVRAGSITYLVQNINTKRIRINSSVLELEKEERRQKLNTIIPYLNFNSKIQKSKNDLITLVKKLKKKNLKIAGYGASGRGTIMTNYCNLSPKFIDFVVDDSSAKENHFMPGTHNLILNPIELLKQKVDYAIVFAWPFITEIRKRNIQFIKNGGKLIIPLPKITITNEK